MSPPLVRTDGFYAEVIAAGRRARARAVDLLIAATALAAELPVYTGNPSDFDGLGGLVEVCAVVPPNARRILRSRGSSASGRSV